LSSSVFLTTAVALLVWAATVAAVSVAVWQSRAVRSAARTPIVVEYSAADGLKSHTALLWAAVHDSMGDDDAQLVYLDPVIDSAPLPPGLDHWPGPGEVVASPELLRRHPEAPARYGRLAATIRAEGLASPAEVLAYIRPQHGITDLSAVLQVSGFGTDGQANDYGEVMDVKPFWLFGGASMFFLVPALVLAWAAAKSGSARHRRGGAAAGGGPGGPGLGPRDCGRRRDALDVARQRLVDLGVDPDTRAEALSGGERSRAALARALVTDPPLVLADEPTGSLDGATRDAVADDLFAAPAARGCGLVVVTHDPAIAGRADRCLNLAAYAPGALR
jgi:hypothetical protein